MDERNAFGREEGPNMKCIRRSSSFSDGHNHKRRRLEDLENLNTSTLVESDVLSSVEEIEAREYVTSQKKDEVSCSKKEDFLDAQSLQDLQAEHQLNIETYQQTIKAQEVTIESQQEIISMLKRDITTQLMTWLEDISYPRSREQEISDNEIEPWMIGFEDSMAEISDLILQDWQKPSSPSESFRYEQGSELDRLISVVSGTGNTFKVQKLRSDYVLRSFMAASVSEWIFKSDFPDLAPGIRWNEFEHLLTERATQHSAYDVSKISHRVANAIEGFEKDILYRRVNEKNFIKNVLPSRASELANRLAPVLVDYLIGSNHNPMEGALPPKLWLPRLEELIEDALKFAIRLRQRKNPTSLEWPNKSAVFVMEEMWALNGGRQLNGTDIALTVMPAAFVEMNGRSGKRLKRGAVVCLDIPEQFVSSDNPSPSKTPLIRNQSGARKSREKVSQISPCRKSNATRNKSNKSAQSPPLNYTANCGKPFPSQRQVTMHQLKCGICREPAMPWENLSPNKTIQKIEIDREEEIVNTLEQATKQSQIDGEIGLQNVENGEKDVTEIEEALPKRGSETGDRSSIGNDAQDIEAEGAPQKSEDGGVHQIENKEVMYDRGDEGSSWNEVEGEVDGGGVDDDRIADGVQGMFENWRRSS